MSWLRFGIAKRVVENQSKLDISERIADKLFRVLKAYNDDLTNVTVINTRFDSEMTGTDGYDLITLEGYMNLDDFYDFKDKHLYDIVYKEYSNIRIEIEYDDKGRKRLVYDENNRRVFFVIAIFVMHEGTRSAYDDVDRYPASIYDEE